MFARRPNAPSATPSLAASATFDNDELATEMSNAFALTSPPCTTSSIAMPSYTSSSSSSNQLTSSSDRRPLPIPVPTKKQKSGGTSLASAINNYTSFQREMHGKETTPQKALKRLDDLLKHVPYFQSLGALQRMKLKKEVAKVENSEFFAGLEDEEAKAFAEEFFD